VVNVLGKDGDTKVISVDGTSSYPTSGALDLLTVSIVGNRDQTPSWAELFMAWLDPKQNILPIDEIFPINQTQQQNDAESAAMMEQSQQDAIYMALHKLGYKIPTHVYISEVKKNAPSSGKLVAADYIQSVNGHTPTTIDGLRALINKYGEKPLTVVVNRGGKNLTYQITPVKDSNGKLVLGIFVGYKYDFPVKVNLELSDIGGPSGGMMFALGIYDTLTPGELTGGAHIAGTGTIDPTGAIGPIGGIQEKMYGASDAGAKYFLAPESNCNEVVGHVPSGMQVFKVSTFDHALDVVKAIGSHADLSHFATCTK
jgi:PDZ domain-containing protein